MKSALVLFPVNCSCRPSNADPLAGVCEKKGGMSDDRKGKAGMIMFLVFFCFFFQLMGISVCGAEEREHGCSPVVFDIHPSVSLCRVNAPTLCG